MTYSDTRALINKIKDSALDYQHSINNIQSSLLSLADSVNKGKTDLTSPDVTKIKTLIALINSKASEIIKSINKSLVASSKALSILNRDANKEMKRLADAYNGSIPPEDIETPRISYKPISLTSVAGCPSYDDGGSNSNSGGKGNNSGGGGNSDRTKSFEYYLNKMLNSEVYSANIASWDSIVQEYLVSNKLDKVISTITFEGKIIKSQLISGQEIKTKDAYKSKDYLVALNKALTHDSRSAESQETDHR